MKDDSYYTQPILLAGSGGLVCSIAVCLLRAGHSIHLYTENEEEALNCLRMHQADLINEENNTTFNLDKLMVIPRLRKDNHCRLAVIITMEELEVKKEKIRQFEEILPADVVIAVNSESIPLSLLQKDTSHPERIIGLNWAEPAHTTQFLEIISNSAVSESLQKQLLNMAVLWDKDPYVVSDSGIRSRLMSAMAREAFYLVENGYASVEDIDRACRNDPGYYLPFAGNCRYMDLMGTYAYGMVMKDLNPNLSTDKHVPVFFTDIIKYGGLGMENGKGLYNYTAEEVKLWRRVFGKFTYQIQQIIDKYPFNYDEEEHQPITD